MGVSDGVLTSMNQGLATHGSLLQMLSTYIFSLPNGLEKGRFWAVDIGGTNLRIMCIDMHPGRDPQVNLFKCKVSESVMTSTEEELFGSIADLIKTHLESMGVTMGGEKMPTGFTFSFPVRQTGLTSGTLVKWAKGFNALGCVGKDVVSMMQTQFDSRGVPLRIDALVENGGFLGAESASAEELRTVFKVVDAVGLRSSRLASVTIVSLLRRMRENGVVGPKERVTIAVDGTVFREYPRYQTRLNEGLRQLLGELTLDNEVNVVTACDEGSGVGAATVVACLQTSAAGG